ncbi:AbrB/MazE/SpoVT family DNA-binding domain-containing protein [Calderihabitans maritimus]|uniref:AbrB family transcriptional regulator n=1 Tax=Calderihabitans maritimus TaxID=1246530 RepID=A0A1Z5HWT1_9FIRM|nr:AbrB/MazE/SpoVT family DNA-binding domain-containing protein [Calderihabitans maritimus]GAW93986.1 AbrB family transcriptional regulator [Calderihabitans maritimus]
MEDRLISPTERGQITIPKEVREKLQITPKTKFRVYVDNNRVVLEPVSSLDLLLKEFEVEAREKGYTRDKIEREIEAVREKLMRDLYGNDNGTT